MRDMRNVLYGPSKALGVMRSGIRTTDRRSLEIALEKNDSCWKADDSERTVARTLGPFGRASR